MRHASLIRLSHDHHHGLALALRCRKQALGQLKPMGSPGLRERAKEVVEFYQTQLVTHFRAEEEILFSLMRESVPESVTLIDDLLTQHEQLRHMISQLGEGSGLAKAIFDVGDLLESHIRKEERELFPLFETRIETVRAEVVGAQLAAMLIDKKEDR
jgi:iron-sulfur cluster repair protein YtfE (RIC family)